MSYYHISAVITILVGTTFPEDNLYAHVVDSKCNHCVPLHKQVPCINILKGANYVPVAISANSPTSDLSFLNMQEYGTAKIV